MKILSDMIGLSLKTKQNKKHTSSCSCYKDFPLSEVSALTLVLKNWCFWTVVLEKILKSPLDFKEIKPVNPEGNQPWIFIGRTLELHLQYISDLKDWLIGKDWCWERLKARGEGDDRGCDGWMASPTQWTWGWESSRSWWRTGKPGVLQSMESQRVRQDWVTELNLS